MTKDPYQILGVSPNASDEEIKQAYRTLARKYHPDNYADSPLADLAEEKMKEINQAYDEIKQRRAAGTGQTNSHSQGYSAGGDERYHEVRRLIHLGEFARADMILEGVSQNDRNAEWHFLKGCTLFRRGWYYDAQRQFETACQMDPQNEEYRSALQQMHSGSAAYGGGYGRRSTADDACTICNTLICADCCCECCGGDLIPGC